LSSAGAMCVPYSHISPFNGRAYASRMLAPFARIDLISVPVRLMPASTRSRIS